MKKLEHWRLFNLYKKAHPNACGCAFRRLGNEYCWGFKK